MRYLFLLVTVWTGLGAASALGQGTVFNYQGSLTDSGRPTTGTYEFRFGLYDAPVGGPAVAPEWGPVTAGVTQGLFQVLLDFGAAAWGSGPRWLEVSLRTNNAAAEFITLAPRQLVTPAPQALVSQTSLLAVTVPTGSITADQVAVGSLRGENLAPGQVVRSVNGLTDEVVLEAGLNVELATNGGALKLSSASWGLQGNSGTEAGADFLGTTDGVPLELRAQNLRGLLLMPFTNGNHVNVIGGDPGNAAGKDIFGVTIAGGGVYDAGAQYVASLYATIGGGAGNQIATNAGFSTIAGGDRNSVSNWADMSVISGGRYNAIGESGSHCTIAGGYQNEIGEGAYRSTIGGGWSNRLAGFTATIAGGSENAVGSGSQFSTIGGGAGNIVEENTRTGTIAGGGRNRISIGAERSVIGGGVDNRIDSGAATAVVGGGRNNQVGSSAVGAVVPGGISNVVAGAHGLAAGYRARADAAGAFVWADATDSDFVGATPNEFAVRATGGVRLVSGVDAAGSPLTGVTLPAGSGSWATLSDRAAKREFKAIDPAEILDRLDRLPLSSWGYRGEVSGARHLGPTAQDFHDAFGLGGDPRQIATVDADGVALAALQGLHRKVQEQQEEIEALRSRLREIEVRLENRAMGAGASD